MCRSCAYRISCLPFIDPIKYSTVYEIMANLRRKLICFGLRAWLIVRKSPIKKQATIAEHVQYLNRLNLSETRYVYLNPKGEIHRVFCRGHGVLALHIEFEGFALNYV